jgi:hypothetical protein
MEETHEDLKTTHNFIQKYMKVTKTWSTYTYDKGDRPIL